jgi:hypothetical protein
MLLKEVCKDMLEIDIKAVEMAGLEEHLLGYL